MKELIRKLTAKKTPEPVHDAPVPETPEDNEVARREASQRVRQHQKRSFFGVWWLVLFLVISLGFQQLVGHLPDFPQSLKNVLGSPPSPTMISGLLVVYSFSALVLILGRMTTGTGSFSSLSHICYLIVFYAFYFVSHSLEDNFYAVVAAGLTILSLEAYHVWIWHQEQIRKEKQYIVRLDRMRQWQRGAR